jgi:shikimate 5-dehydrogenase
MLEDVTRDTICVDITYDPRSTQWMETHRQLGCRVTNGLGMLAYTVARQMNWWWDSDIPGAYLLDALTKVLQ